MLCTCMCNRFQQQHFSLRAPAASIASTKAVAMALSLTCPLLCTARLFPKQRQVPLASSSMPGTVRSTKVYPLAGLLHATLSKRSAKATLLSLRWRLLFALGGYCHLRAKRWRSQKVCQCKQHIWLPPDPSRCCSSWRYCACCFSKNIDLQMEKGAEPGNVHPSPPPPASWDSPQLLSLSYMPTITPASIFIDQRHDFNLRWLTVTLWDVKWLTRKIYSVINSASCLSRWASNLSFIAIIVTLDLMLYSVWIKRTALGVHKPLPTPSETIWTNT